MAMRKSKRMEGSRKRVNRAMKQVRQETVKVNLEVKKSRGMGKAWKYNTLLKRTDA